jgi:ABC-type Fe3+-hydroxamate transport system substrate-binding protein
LGCEPIITPYNFDIKTVDFEILLNENPEFILFDDTNLPSMFFAADNDVYEEWKNIPAINEGRFAVAPALMHSILGSAIFAQSIGMLWMAVVLSHQESDIDIVAEMQLFYEISYGLERDESSIGNLLGIVKGD